MDESIDKYRLYSDFKAFRGIKYKPEDDVKLIQKAIHCAKSRGDQKYLIEEDFQIPKRRGIEKAKQEMNKLIGLKQVKEELEEVVARLVLEQKRKQRGYRETLFSMHMTFLGNPGVAKTTVARLLGKWLTEEGLLKSGVFKEVSRKDLIGQYVGHTAPQVQSIFEEVKGGVLFIDEAYSLFDAERASDGFSGEAIAELIQQMENNQDTMVIFAGYKGKKMDGFLNSNPGLKSRIGFHINFKDYTEQELWEIVKYLSDEAQFLLEEGIEDQVREFFAKRLAQRDQTFGNGREARRLLERAVTQMAKRIKVIGSDEISLITNEDMRGAIGRLNEEIFKEVPVVSQKRIGFSLE